MHENYERGERYFLPQKTRSTQKKERSKVWVSGYCLVFSVHDFGWAILAKKLIREYLTTKYTKEYEKSEEFNHGKHENIEKEERGILPQKTRKTRKRRKILRLS